MSQNPGCAQGSTENSFVLSGGEEVGDLRTEGAGLSKVRGDTCTLNWHWRCLR